MKTLYLTILLFTFSLCHAEFSDHLKKQTGPRVKKKQIKNIDYIYIINLDHRPDRFQKCVAEFAPYHIVPARFSAVNGAELSQKAINEVGVPFQPGMHGDEWVLRFPLEKEGASEHDFLREECFGKTVFFRWITQGGIGCALSHLSVLQDAYDAGYETIWVMEDDILLERDPHVLSELIVKLDKLVGKEGWDILYTSSDFDSKELYPEDEDLESDLKSDLWFYWRPDVGLKDRKKIARRTVISEDFVQIGSRIGAYSMIVRRSGMKKILDFLKEHHIFTPYDHELATIPGIRLFNLRYDLLGVSRAESGTDYHAKKNQWETYKKKTISDLSHVHGWRSPKKAEHIMEFVHEKKPALCVEIGSFGGCITYPLARTLQFLKKGVVHAIDAWDIQEAVKGLDNVKQIRWWQTINMEAMHQHFERLIAEHHLEKYCIPIHKRSTEAASSFKDGSIDFLFLDGNESPEGSLKDVLLYYPKVKEGGYIWLNGAGTFDKNQATKFLMKNCEWLKEESLGMDCVVFQKNKASL